MVITEILDRFWRPSASIAESPVAGETVLLHLLSGVYYGLDEIGTTIWTALKAGADCGRICEDMSRDYGIDTDRARHDLRNFLTELVDRGLLVDD